MITLDSFTNENNKEHPYIILIIGDSGSGKTNSLLHLIKEQDEIDKI